MPVLRDVSYIRTNIETIVSEYCEFPVSFRASASPLNKAHFVEYFLGWHGPRSAPQLCADRLVAYVEELLEDHGHV